MKTIFLTFLLTIASTVAVAQEAVAQLVIGNCTDAGSSEQLEYVGRDAGTGYAISFSRYKMQAYRGCRMTAVSIEFDGKAEGTLFLTRSIGDTPFYTQPFTARSGRNTFVLTTPYDIDGSELTFGYTCDALATGTLVYTDALVEGKEYVNQGAGWEAFTKGSALITATIEGPSLPAAEVALASVNLPTYIRPATEATATADVANLGTDRVSSLTVDFHQGEECFSATIEGLDIAPRTKQRVSIPFTLTTDGDYSLWMDITAVNGQPDAAPIDNASAQQPVYVREAFTERNVLLEVFSTERCTNCPSGHETIAATLANKSRLIEMTHHAGFFTDRFTIPESVEYEWFYKSPQYTTTFAPAFMTDRTAWASLPDFYPYGTPVAMNLSAKALRAAYTEAAAVPALATINLMPHYDTTTRSLTIDVSAQALVASPDCQHPALNVFIVEDGVYSTTQENTFGSYRHPHLVRQCLTTVWGEAFAAGGSISRSYSLTLPDEWDAAHTSVVAFVANYDAASSANCRVLQASESAVPTGGIVDGIDCPTHHSSNIIYNPLGQRLSSAALPGVYIIGGRCTVR